MRLFGRKDISGTGADGHYGAMDLLRDIVSCLLLMVAAGGWTFLCLLILSFMLVYYIPFHLKWMIPVSVAVGLAAGILYVVNAVRRRKK